MGLIKWHLTGKSLPSCHSCLHWNIPINLLRTLLTPNRRNKKTVQQQQKLNTKLKKHNHPLRTVMAYSSENMKSWMVKLMVTFLLISTSFLCGESKPYHIDKPEMDPIDTCLFTCDFCYVREALVRCANDCIASEGIMGPVWSQTCPYFAQQPIFPSHKLIHK